MIAAFLTTMLVAVASAFLPAIPIEPYLVGLVTTTHYDPVLLGIAAGVGQAAGKLVIFLAARGTVRSARLRRWLKRHAEQPAEGAVPTGSPARPPSPVRRRTRAIREGVATLARRATPPAFRRWSVVGGRLLKASSERLIALLDRPVVATVTVFLSAVLGVPPLLVTSVYAAGTRMPAYLFGVTCLVGRSIRFVAIALAPQLIMN
jgi:membrane protein YqaA with SNARE-associated domain